MAKKTRVEEIDNVNEIESKNLDSAPADLPPAGFQRSGAADDAPWVQLAEGMVIHGKLLGRYVMQGDDPRAYYQIQLYRSCKVRTGTERDGDLEIIDAGKGDVVNLNENTKTKVLCDKADIVAAGGAVDVWIQVKKKIRLQGGKTMWSIDAQHKIVRAPTVQLAPRSSNNVSVETPF